jgi:ERCC4-type nuclease
MIHVIVDTREQHSAVPAALAALGHCNVETRTLKCGGYLLDDALLFERKTLRDLVASIKDGRLFAQALRLRSAATCPALVLEGTAQDLRDCAMSWEAIQGALAMLALSIQIPLLRTRSATETAKTMLFAAQQRTSWITSGLPRKGRRPRAQEALQRYILQGLPGIGPERASRLLQRFGSVASVMVADPAALAEVAGIGAHTAARIQWAVGRLPR